MTGETGGEVTAALVVIGDEVLSGRTRDQHIATIAAHCTAIGIRLREARVVSDDEEAIVAAVNALRPRHDYVFTTGGIGPTHDDVTFDAIAKAFGVGIGIDERAVALLRQRYAEHELTPARLRMARIPHGAELIENAASKAPGCRIGNVVVMAGVPDIMRAMLQAVTPQLRTGRRLISRSLRVEKPEGEIAAPLLDAQREFPDVAMGSYPFREGMLWGTNIVLRSPDPARLDAASSRLASLLEAVGVSASELE